MPPGESAGVPLARTRPICNAQEEGIVFFLAGGCGGSLAGPCCANSGCGVLSRVHRFERRSFALRAWKLMAEGEFRSQAGHRPASGQALAPREGTCLRPGSAWRNGAFTALSAVPTSANLGRLG